MSLPARLLVITDRAQAARPLPALVADACAGGCRWLLVREKDLPQAELLALARALAAAAAPHGCAVSVSAAVAVAAQCGARGVHLPQGGDVAQARRALGAGALIGVSAHSLDEARRAAAEGADYITLSPVFASASKPGYGPALGLAALGQLAAAVPLPVLALGGVTPATAGACLRAGAAGVAVMGEVMRAAAPAQLVAGLLRDMDAG